MPSRVPHSAAALILALASGMAALMHELLWTRRLTDLLGASAESSARVFGCFFLGLALGAGIAGKMANHVTRPWRAVTLAEAGVAVCSLPILFLPAWTQWIWPALGEQGLIDGRGGGVKLALSVLTLLPPAFCMGLVLPMVLKGMAGGIHERGSGIRLYALNTCGGAAGLLTVTLLALPLLGVCGSIGLAAAVNLLVAAAAVALDRATPPIVPPEATPVAGDWPMPRSSLAIAFFSGAAVLAIEVAATQLLMLVASLSFYAPAAILFSVISTLGATALVAPWLAHRLGRVAPSGRMALVMGSAAIATAFAPFIFMSAAGQGNWLAENATVGVFMAKLTVLALCTVGPGLALAGLVFPLTVLSLEDGRGDKASRLAALLAVNGIGGTIGAEFTWRVLIPLCGLAVSIGLVAALYALVGAVLAWTTTMRPAWKFAAVTPALLVLCALAILPSLPMVNTHVGLRILDHRAGREGTVAVVENERGSRSILISNQYLLGSSGARWDQERQTHLPLLLHPAPRSAAFIGLATGISPGAALAHRDLRDIVAVELSPLVARAADRYFSEFNGGITRSNRARVIVEDGRTYIGACEQRFDVIVGDLFLPWAPGEGRLFSEEHFHAVRRALRPGGLFCQWLPMYQLTPREFEAIAGTFRAAFPRAAIFSNGFAGDAPALAMVGFRDGTPVNWETVFRRCAEAREKNEVRDPLLRHGEGVALLALGELGAEDRSPAPPRNTLGNLWLELDAARERLTGQPGAKYYFGSRWFQFCAERRARRAVAAGDTPPLDPDLPHLADLWMRWELARRVDPGAAPSIASALRARMPVLLRDDPSSDWQRWAGSALPWKPNVSVQAALHQIR